MFRAECSDTGAERVLPMKESRKRSFPRPRGGQDAFRGRSFGGSAVFPCRFCVKGDGARHPAAERVARLWAPPAPSRRALRGSAGGGFPGFADFTTWDCSAPAPGTVRSRLRAGAILCITTIQSSCATPAETFVPDPRERYPKNFFCLFPRAGHKDSSASHSPGELGSPAPACRG